MNNRHRTLINVLAAGILPGLAAPVAHAVDVYLSAQSYSNPAAGGVEMWGYASCTDGTFASCGDPSSPGPEITVPVGDTTLRVHLQNSLSEATSIMIYGQTKPMQPQTFTDGQGRQRIRAFDEEATASGGIRTYEWSNLRPGTYLYQSASHVQKQVQMGLYGVMKHDFASGPVRPAAYDLPARSAVIAGFESPDVADGSESTTADGWTVAGHGGVFDPAGDAVLVPTEGTQAGWATSTGMLSLNAGTVTAFTDYSFSVDVGDRADRDFAGYSVGVYADGTLLAGETDATIPPSGGFQTWTYAPSAAALAGRIGQTLEVRLASTAAPPIESAIAVPGFGFESPDVADGTESLTADSWTLSGTGRGGVSDPAASVLTPTEGSQTGWSNGRHALAQVLGETLQPNTRYTLRADVGDRSNSAFAGYSVGLYAGGTLLAQDADTLAPASGFLTSTVSFTTPETVTAGQSLEIRLASTASPPAPPLPFTLANASFENPNLSDGSASSTPNQIAPWMSVGGAGTAGVVDPRIVTGLPSSPATSPATNYQAVPAGTNINNGPQVGFSNRVRYLRQRVGTIQEGTKYTLRVWVGDSTSTAFHGYSVGLYAADGTPLATPMTGDMAALNNTWQQITAIAGPVTNPALLGQQLEIRLSSNAGANTSNTARTFFDYVTIESVTEDPKRTDFDNVSLMQLPIDQRRTVFDNVHFTSFAPAGSGGGRSDYDVSQTVVFSEVDPTLHTPPAPANATVDGYLPRYFLINGTGTPANLVAVAPGARVLLRLVNAGLQNRAPQLLGGIFELLAEDGHATAVSRRQYNTLLPAGKSLDVMFVAPATPGTYVLYDRRLGLDGGSGQLGYIVVAAP